MQLKYANFAAYNTTIAKHGINKLWWCWHIKQEVWGYQHLMYKTATVKRRMFKGLATLGSTLVLFCPIPKTNNLNNFVNIQKWASSTSILPSTFSSFFPIFFSVVLFFLFLIFQFYWYITLYRFKVYSIKIWLTYVVNW